jgi:predicted CXXCH cytochrome family protein
MLPSDHVWSSGPLANVHRTPEIGSDCQACHLDLFERAPDRGCLDCHAGVTGHVDRSSVSVPLLEAKRCAGCHREHHEPSDLVRDDSELCAECHRRPERQAVALGDESLPEPVSGFSEAGHPEFRLALLRLPPDGGDWRLERLPHSSETPLERSNLKFPHDLHLDPAKVESLRTGQPLDCASCHVLADDGEHFEAITMERACRDCHSLSFDDDFPRKQLPHGDVEDVLVALEEHYIRKFADPELRGGVRERGRRRPGRSEDAEQCDGTALECGRRQAMQEADNQFSRSGCVTCHEVAAEPERPFLERWKVRAVRIVDDWYPYSRFDHIAHLTRSEARLDGEAACTSCHAAQTSTASEDVLMPGLDNCLQCHGSGGTRETRVALSCRGCHDFHLPFRGAMKGGDGAVSRADDAVTPLDGE